MNMVSVNSSDIASIGYENRVLHILFRNGGLYEYSNVPESVYRSLMSAASHGKYFHAHIKGKYGYRRIG